MRLPIYDTFVKSGKMDEINDVKLLMKSINDTNFKEKYDSNKAPAEIRIEMS